MGLDLADRFVRLDGGDRVGFDGLVIATGAAARVVCPGSPISGRARAAHPRRLPGLRAELDDRPERVVVIGAGFIGAEVAATCRERGLEVTHLEARRCRSSERSGREMGMVCAELHR